MFGFLKRKKKEEKSNDSYDTTIRTVTGLSAAESARASVQKNNERFAKPSNYTGNRNLYDDGKAKKFSKLNSFSNNDVVKDPYTGDDLVLKKADAKRLYGDDWQNHLAESDHIHPIERVFGKTKNNPWLDNNDIKNIANDSDNLQTVSRKFNNAKRSRTNEEFVDDEEYLESKGIYLSEEGKKRAIETGRNAEKNINKNIGKTSIKNVVTTGHEAGLNAATNSACMVGMMSSINNIKAVLSGEKEADEAIIDVTLETGVAAGKSYIMAGSLNTICHSLSSSSSKFVQALSQSNVPGKVITAVALVGSTLKRYGNGEISTQECIMEIGEKGLNMATTGYSMLIGQMAIPIPVVGATIGALVGSALSSQYYNQLMNKLKQKKLEHEERLRLIEESERVAEEAKNYRLELEEYLARYFRDYQDCFDEALSGLKLAFLNGDADGVIGQANKITRKLGGNVYYENVEEFKDFLDSDEVDIL